MWLGFPYKEWGGGAMLEKIRAAITDDNEISKEWQRFASLALLLFAFVLALLPYERKRLGGLWHTNVSITPEFLSACIALALIAPLYLRGLLKWNRSPFTTISFVLILGVFASFVQLSVFGGKSWVGTVNFYMVMIALVLSWIGLRGVAGIAWIIVLLAGIYNVHSTSTNLGFAGYLYICSAFLGLCFHSGVNPGELVSSLKDEYSPGATYLKKRVVDDVSAAGQLLPTSMKPVAASQPHMTPQPPRTTPPPTNPPNPTMGPDR